MGYENPFCSGFSCQCFLIIWFWYWTIGNAWIGTWRLGKCLFLIIFLKQSLKLLETVETKIINCLVWGSVTIPCLKIFLFWRQFSIETLHNVVNKVCIENCNFPQAAVFGLNILHKDKINNLFAPKHLWSAIQGFWSQIAKFRLLPWCF